MSGDTDFKEELSSAIIKFFASLSIPKAAILAANLVGDCFILFSFGSTRELEIMRSSSLSDDAKLVMEALLRMLVICSEVIIPLDLD